MIPEHYLVWSKNTPKISFLVVASLWEALIYGETPFHGLAVYIISGEESKRLCLLPRILKSGVVALKWGSAA